MADRITVGSLSDRLDRRTVVVVLATAVAALMVVLLFVGARDGKAFSGDLGPLMQAGAFLLTFLLGGMLFPIYSVASSLAFDRAEGRSMIDISTSLLVIFSLGSITGPFVVMAVAEMTDSVALALCVLVSSSLIIVTGLRQKVFVAAVTGQVSSAVIIPESSVEMVQAAATVVEEESRD